MYSKIMVHIKILFRRYSIIVSKVNTSWEGIWNTSVAMKSTNVLTRVTSALWIIELPGNQQEGRKIKQNRIQIRFHLVQKPVIVLLSISSAI